MPPQPPQVFSVRGFEALFPSTGTPGCVVYLTPQLFLPVYLHMTVGPPSVQATASSGPPATTLPPVLSTWLPISAPPTCFFFNSMVVGLPYSSIFCQFCCFSFLNLLLSFFWLFEEAQCIFLRLHLG